MEDRQKPFILIAVVIALCVAQPIAAANFAPNEVIVEVERGYRPAVDYAMERVDASDVKTGSEFLLLTINDGRRVRDVIQQLRRIPGVRSAEPNYYAQLFTEPAQPTHSTPDDTAYSGQYHHSISTGVQSPVAWNTQTGSSNIVVATIDSGTDTDHQDLDGNLWRNTDEIAGNGIDDDGNGKIDDINGWDFIDNDNTPVPRPDGIDNDGYYGADDNVTHGTHVAGIIAMEGDNAEGGAGIAWDVQLMSVKVYGDDAQTTYLTIANGINYAVSNGADIINMSFGGTGNSALLSNAISNAVANDVTLVAAAGNESINLNTLPYYPICYSGVIGVAASNSSRTAAGYSNYGSNCVDVTAPGSSIYSTLYTDDPTYGFTSDYGTLTGTSMAAPIVSGIAALILSENSSLSATTVKNILVASADATNFSSAYGAGLVNAGKAVAGAHCVADDNSVTEPTFVYYADTDSDSLGDPDTYIYSCAASAPTGYVSNNTDTNDSASAIEIPGDGIDNDGDGKIDEVNTLANNGAHPVYAHLDPAEAGVFKNSIQKIRYRKNGTIRVTYADDTIYAYDPFPKSTKHVKAVRRKKSSYLVVVHPRGKKVVLLNLLNGQIVDTKKLRNTKHTHVNIKSAIQRNRHTVVVTTKDDTSLQVSLLQAKKTAGMLKKHSVFRTTDPSIVSAARVKRTQLRKKRVIVRDNIAEPLTYLKVTKSFNLRELVVE